MLAASSSTIHANSVEPFEPRARQLMDTHPLDDGTDDDNLASSLLSNAPKLSVKYNSFSGLSQAKDEEIWTIREVPNGEEQLYAKGRCVYWTRNSLIIKSFNFTDQVIRVFWNDFNGTDHICCALSSGLSIFDHLGRHHQMLLPFSYREMYSTNLGLLVERNCDSSEDANLPVLFALTHPTKEISPVIFRPMGRTAQNSRTCAYSVSSFISIVTCHDKLPLCLTYDSHECQHSIWKIRESTPEEIEEFNIAGDDSLCTPTNTLSQSNYSIKTPEGFSHSSLNLSNRQKSSLAQQSSSTATVNFSPKIETKSKHSTLGNLAASRLGAGYNQIIGDPTIPSTTGNVKSFKESLQTFDTVSTPNKNRIINYLRDNIEEPILPELTLAQVWTDSTNNSLRASKFFNTIDLVGDEYMVIVIPASSQIKILRYEGDPSDIGSSLPIGRSINLQAIDANPIESMNMMLVMDSARNFILYTGFDRVTSINIPIAAPTTFRAPPTSSPANARNPPCVDMSPIQSSSARKRISISERSSIGSDFSFHQIFQTLSPVPHAGKNETKTTSSPLLSCDTMKIERVIGQYVYLCSASNQRIRVEIPTVYQTNYVGKLINAMKSLVSRELGLLIVSNWYQTRRSASQPELMKAEDEMNLFKTWFLSCLGLEQDIFGQDDLSNLDLSIKLPQLSPNKKSRRLRDSSGNPILANVNVLFYSLHLVFEDLMLTPLNYGISYNLAELLLVLSCILKLQRYQHYYWLRFPDLQKKFGDQKSKLENSLPRLESLYMPPYFNKYPPSAIDYITKLIVFSQIENLDLNEEPLIPFPNIPGVTDNSYTIIKLFSELFGIGSLEVLFNLTPSYSESPKPIILDSRPQRSVENDRRVVELLVGLGKGKNFLSSLPTGLNLYLWDAILNCRESPPLDWSEFCYELIGRLDLVNLACGRSKTTKDNEDETLKLLFPDDIRVSEAQRMLASDTPVEFSIVHRQGATEEETRDETHRHLYLLNVRTMAMSLGRGAISMRTYSPVIGESFEVPRLELSGRVISEERPIEYNHDFSVYPWPFFHNGVAAGLTICASTASNIIDSTWINYNRPKSNIPHTDIRDRDLAVANVNNEHAGFLFALGLNGHLEKLSLMALHDYLCQNNDLTKLAILLGMSAAKRGSRDTNIIKVLSIHVDALLPPNSTELDVSSSVHAASIIGVGLLYQGSGDSHISRVLLEEIGRLPGPEANSNVDRESYSLSAGLAFGLVNLCKGGSATISSSDQLRLYMLGGKRKPLTAVQRQRYFKQDCHRGEEEYINTHITSPGGTLGLGLMYHRSHNVSVAMWMLAPDTQTLLEYVRPDFLMLRMISYGLIMWDKVEPTGEYIHSQIPRIVSTNAFQKTPSPALSRNSADAKNWIDYELISQAYCNLVAGCCMAIALRYAGTADKTAYKTIYRHTKMMIAVSNKPALVEQAGRPCVESCLNVLITSLAVLMAGTGDLGVMRVCRYLRSRLTQSCVFYGSYMAIHMALGILFLGACRYSFSASPEAIGALICALYPIYPNHSSDNRYHLQALRHLYVLAAEPRLLIPYDISTNQPVYVNVIVNQKQTNGEYLKLKLKLPCLMPEIDTIEKLSLDDDRYWHIEINDKRVLMKCLLQEHGHLSVKQKARPSNNQLVKNIEEYILSNMTKGEPKSRKQSALTECLADDRVEQFPALNRLINESSSVAPKYLSLFMEQLFICRTLSRIKSIRPIIDRFVERLADEEAEEHWMEYLESNDWTQAKQQVAHFVCLNNMKFCEGLANPSVIKNADSWLLFFG